VWQSQHFPFFWDTIQLGSKHAHHYYETGFAELLLPDTIDSGHPPGFGLYLAAVWSLFGKSLTISHWSMLPFILGIVRLLFPIGRYFSKAWGWVFPLLALALPPVSGQLLLVSPDVVLVFGFLLGLYGVFYQKNWPRVAGAIILAALSTRGMMTVVVLFLFDLYLQFAPLSAPSDIPKGKQSSLPANSKSKMGLPVGERPMPKARTEHAPYLRTTTLALQILPPYLPSGLLALAFLLYHYLEKGWIGYHAGSEWAPSFVRVEMIGFLKNAATLTWRLLDYGMVFSWIALGIVLWREPKILRHPKVRAAVWLTGISLFLLTPTFLLYSGLQQHRYLLPVLLALLLLTFTVIAQSTLGKLWKTGWFALVFAGLVTGHFWVYPDPIAQSWDTTLAHLPYFQLKAKMIDYLDEEDIPLEEVGTAFPEIGPQNLKDLSGRNDGFAPRDLAAQRYILYSNVMNDFSDAEREQLEAAWSVDKKMERGGVKLILYRKY
jgi:hypothetical protein